MILNGALVPWRKDNHLKDCIYLKLIAPLKLATKVKSCQFGEPVIVSYLVKEPSSFMCSCQCSQIQIFVEMLDSSEDSKLAPYCLLLLSEVLEICGDQDSEEFHVLLAQHYIDGDVFADDLNFLNPIHHCS